MVEGPKVVLKVQRIQSLKGQSLVAMTVDPTQTSSLPLTTPMQKCIGKVVRSIWCLGKELFITMADQTDSDGDPLAADDVIGIRLHFGMAGSERLIDTSTLLQGYHLQNLRVVASKMMPKQSRKKWTACLIFNNQALFVYDSSLCTKTSHYLDNAFRCLERDVMMFDKFSIDSVINKIRESDQSRNIHEVIMDQTILPGVGNVIKIEGLFDAGMHPHCLTSDIDDAWLTRLIRKLRDYARYWYDCCKGPGANKPNRKNVYGRSHCGVCNSIIALIRDGVLQRITYLCSTCQLFPAQHCEHEKKLKLQRENPPVRVFAPGGGKICLEIKQNPDANVKNPPPPDWNCPRCTMSNKYDLMICEICGAARPTNGVKNAAPSSSSLSCAYYQSNNSLLTDTVDLTGDSSVTSGVDSNYHQGQGQGNVGVQAYKNINSSVPSSSRGSGNLRDIAMNKDTNNENLNMVNNSSSNSNYSNQSNIQPTQLNNTNITQKIIPTKDDTDGCGHSFIIPLFCKCNKQSGLHRVRKSGPTNSRLFWTCSVRKCDFFSWADGTFPKCQHGAPCTVRRVLKPGPTNGQYFFSCSQETKCTYFLWSSKHVTPRPVCVSVCVPPPTGTLKRSHLSFLTDSIPSKRFKEVTIPL